MLLLALASPAARAASISYWHFDEAAGATAADSVGSNPGMLGSAAAHVAGLVGPGALSFNDTTNASVNFGAGAGFTTTTGITVETLFATTWDGTDHQSIFRKEDGASRIMLALNNRTPSDTIAWGLNIGGSYTELWVPLDGTAGRPTVASLGNGAMHHLVATYDAASGLRGIYFDGALIGSDSFAANALLSTGGSASAFAGTWDGFAEPYGGILDEMAFYSHALTATEVAAHYASAQAGQPYASAVPEPGATALVCAAAAAVARSRRRRV